jgi:hypothetical protein
MLLKEFSALAGEINYPKAMSANARRALGQHKMIKFFFANALLR